METKYCECGCGGELKTWKNNRTGPFLRGHHMRKKGWKPPATGKHYCECGCGTEIEPLKNGHIRRYVKGHHLKGNRLSLEYRIERTKKRWGKEPILSPYLEETFVAYSEKMKRWTACTRTLDGKVRNLLHAKAVYECYFGEIPAGYVVHHKDGKHCDLHDDRPDNLMVLPDKWNLRFFPTLAEGFGVSEKVVTDCYLKVFQENVTSEELFALLCEELIKEKHVHCNRARQ